MPFRLAAAATLAASLWVAGPAFGREQAKDSGKAAPVAAKSPSGAAKTPAPPAKPAGKPSIEAREPAGGSPGKQRQRACIAEWRAFSAAEKTAQGPGWPQFYSKCVKRLKGAQRG